jgi:hypothetical protein
MRDIVFAWTDEKGMARISYPVWNNKKPHETDEQFLKRVASKFPKPIALRTSSLPSDRTNRNLWVIRDGKVVVEDNGQEDLSHST